MGASMAEIADELLKRIAHSMPQMPWGIGSRREDSFAFARAVVAEVYRRRALGVAEVTSALSSGLTAFCEWREQDPWGAMPGTHESACGEAWAFTEGGPAENNFRFCHGCGKPVTVIPFPAPAPTPAKCRNQSECANPTACEQEGVCVRTTGVEGRTP
jgi:hypothetical protein